MRSTHSTSAAFGFAAQIKVIAHQQQEGLALAKIPGASYGMAIPEWGFLFDKMQAGGTARGPAISGLIPGMNHDTNFLHAGLDHFVDDDRKSGLLQAIAVHQRLQRQGPLISPRRCDNRFFNIHAAGFSVSGERQRHKFKRDRQRCGVRT